MRVLTKNHMPDLSKLDTLLYRTQSKGLSGTIPRLEMCRFLISLSKITHQMWRDHPFSQRNEATKSAFGLEVGGEVVVLDKI